MWIVKPVLFSSIGVFMVKMLMIHCTYLIGLLGIHLNLRRLVMFLDIHVLILVHFILYLIMLLSSVICVILLTMLLICVLIMHAMLNLTMHHLRTILTLSWLIWFILSFSLVNEAWGGWAFGVVAKLSVVVACLESEDTFDEVYDLVETPLEGSSYVFIHEDFPSLGCNIVLPNPLDHSHVSPMYLQSSQSPEYHLDVPLVILWLVMLIWI